MARFKKIDVTYVVTTTSGTRLKTVYLWSSNYCKTCKIAIGEAKQFFQARRETMADIERKHNTEFNMDNIKAHFAQERD